jgi:hypothetical protein
VEDVSNLVLKQFSKLDFYSQQILEERFSLHKNMQGEYA